MEGGDVGGNGIATPLVAPPPDSAGPAPGATAAARWRSVALSEPTPGAIRPGCLIVTAQTALARRRTGERARK